MIEKLREQVDLINAQLGTGIRVAEKGNRYYTYYQLQDGEGRPLHPSWRNYETMAYHLGTVMAVLGQARREGP